MRSNSASTAGLIVGWFPTASNAASLFFISLSEAGPGEANVHAAINAAIPVPKTVK